MYKKLLYFLLGSFFFAGIAFAAPSSQNFNNIQPFTTDTYTNGTALLRWLNVFTKFASTTQLTVTTQLTSTGTTTLATTTTSVLNGVVVVDGVSYPKTNNGLIAALAACQKGVVQIPPNSTIALTSVVVIPSGCSLQGFGDSSLITEAAGSQLTFPSGVASSSIRNLRINASAQSAASSDMAIKIQNPNDVTIDGVTIQDASCFGVFAKSLDPLGGVYGKVTITNFNFNGLGNCDVIGGGPGDATSTLAEIIIDNGFVSQDASIGNNYYSAIDIVAQHNTTISNVIAKGGIYAGGEKVPHQRVNISHNILTPPKGKDWVQIAVFTSPNEGAYASSSQINIEGNNIYAGHILVQGIEDAHPTVGVNIIGNNIVVSTSTASAELREGIDLQNSQKVTIAGNTISGGDSCLNYFNVRDMVVGINNFKCPIVSVPTGTNSGISSLFSDNGVWSLSSSLGISTTTPWKTLSVDGGLAVTDKTGNVIGASGYGSGDATLYVARTEGEGTPPTTSGTVAQFISNFTSAFSSSLSIISGTAATAALHFGDKDSDVVGGIAWDNSVNSFNISGGNVGIDITPTAKLDVNGNLKVRGIGAFSGAGLNYFSDKLGLGTTSPEQVLSIQGSSPQIQLFDTNQTDPSGLFFVQNTANALNIYSGRNGVSGSEKLSIAGNGGATVTSVGVAIQNTSGGVFTGTTLINLPVSGSSYFNNGSNVGIGTTSPYAVLSVVGSTGVVADHYTATSTSNASTFPYASTTALTSTGNFWLNTTGYPQGIIGALDASPNFNVEVNSQSQGSYTSVGMKNGSQAGGMVLDTIDTFNGLTNFLTLTNINSPMTCLGFSNQTLGCAYSDNGLDTLVDFYPPSGGKEMTYTNSLPQTNGTNFRDNYLMNYDSTTGLISGTITATTKYAQPLASVVDGWWEQQNGNTSEASSSWNYFVASTTPFGKYGTTSVVALGDVGTSTYSITKGINNGINFNGATIQLISSSTRYQALGVYNGANATSTQLFGVYNDGTASTSKLLVTFGTTTNATSTSLNVSSNITIGSTGAVDSSLPANSLSAAGGASFGSNVWITPQARGIWFNSVGTFAPGLERDASNNLAFIGTSNNTVSWTYLVGQGYWGFGSSSPSARVSIQANPSDYAINPMLFVIGSSTASATTTLFSVSNIGSTTIGNFGTCSGTNALTTTAAGTIVCGAITGSGGGGFGEAWQFFGSKGWLAPTTTVGVIVNASSTIGNGAQNGGLIVSGGSTTTLNAYFAGLVGIATTSPTKALEVSGDEYITGAIGIGVKALGGSDADLSVVRSGTTASISAQSTNTSGVTTIVAKGDVSSAQLEARGSGASNSNLAVIPSSNLLDVTAGTGGLVVLQRQNAPIIFGTGGIAFTNERARILGTGETGFASTSPYARLSIHANPTDTNVDTTLFAIGSSTQTSTTTLFSVSNTGSTTASNGFNITAGCFAISSNCLSHSNLSGTVPIANGGTNAITQTSNGVGYYDGSKITTGTGLTYDATTLTNNNGGVNAGNFVGTSTTVANSLASALTITLPSNVNTALTLANPGGGDFPLKITTGKYGMSIDADTGVNPSGLGLVEIVTNQNAFNAIKIADSNNGSGQNTASMNIVKSGNNAAAVTGLWVSVANAGAGGTNAAILSGGKVGVGTTSPLAVLSVHANNGETNTVLFAVGSSTQTATTTHFYVTNTGATFAPNTASSGGAQTGYWCYDANGQLIRDTVVCIAVSAKRFKENINYTPAFGLSELLQLNPVSFTWKADFNKGFENNPNYNGTQYSLIADEVQKVDPRLVSVETATTTYEGVTYPPGTVAGLSAQNNWIALFTQSIKDLNAKVDGKSMVVTAQRSIEENWQWEYMGLITLAFFGYVIYNEKRRK